MKLKKIDKIKQYQLEGSLALIILVIVLIIEFVGSGLPEYSDLIIYTIIGLWAIRITKLYNDDKKKS